MAEPLTLKENSILNITTREGVTRNTNYTAISDKKENLFIKRVSAMDALSEVAAREMAEITGFKGLIPCNTVAKDCEIVPVETSTLSSQWNHPPQQGQVTSAAVLHSRQAIAEGIAQAINRNLKQETNLGPAIPTPRAHIQGLVLKIIFNLRTAVYRTKVQEGKLSKLLYIQDLLSDAKVGVIWYDEFFSAARIEPKSAETLLNSIEQRSFEDDFLLQIVLGSQDANVGNTLFADTLNAKDHTVTKLYSIDHERIMPENIYNITKFIPCTNGGVTTERAIDNEFPIRLWLAGLPQAEVSFSKDTMKKILASLDPNRLLAYHRQKRFFTPAAVSAQIERVQLIRSLFEVELQQLRKKPLKQRPIVDKISLNFQKKALKADMLQLPCIFLQPRLTRRAWSTKELLMDSLFWQKQPNVLNVVVKKNGALKRNWTVIYRHFN